jgi:hypothetical protein
MLSGLIVGVVQAGGPGTSLNTKFTSISTQLK